MSEPREKRLKTLGRVLSALGVILASVLLWMSYSFIPERVGDLYDVPLVTVEGDADAVGAQMEPLYEFIPGSEWNRLMPHHLFVFFAGVHGICLGIACIALAIRGHFRKAPRAHRSLWFALPLCGVPVVGIFALMALDKLLTGDAALNTFFSATNRWVS